MVYCWLLYFVLKCPLNLLQLFNWALEPAEDETLDKLYELGYLDAAVWAEQNSAELITKNGQSLVADWIKFCLLKTNFGVQSWVHGSLYCKDNTLTV